MAAPTLTLASVVTTLPSPAEVDTITRDFDLRQVQRRTVSGILRTTILSYGFIYRLGFRMVSLSSYNAIRDLWLAAVAAGVYPTFDYPSVYADAVAVPVALTLGPAISSTSADASLVNFTLELVEANPR